MGHAEKFCPRLYDTPANLLEKLFGVWMRVTQKKPLNLVVAKWLRFGGESEVINFGEFSSTGRNEHGGMMAKFLGSGETKKGCITAR